ncbi:MAG: sulfatase-like hydrolase/transferase [Acidobacteria bacterium]|nr:sulfatase-like hydrolase/transferase [Acidobacteriota bacterium]
MTNKRGTRPEEMGAARQTARVDRTGDIPAGALVRLSPAGLPRPLPRYLRDLILLGLPAILLCADRTTPQSPRLPSGKTPVVLVTIDTLRADRLSCYGYTKSKTANIDSLAQDGVLFENAFVQTPITLPSHASILTGTYPMYHKVQDVVGRLREGVPTLAEAFKQNGYATGAFVGSTVLSSRWGLNRGFDVYDDRFDVREGLRQADFDRLERRADDVLTPALAWLEANAKSSLFMWLHLFDPHDPYTPPPPFADEYKDRPYDGEIAYVDVTLGKFFARLKSLGLYDRSLIVFLSDHGESLGEHREMHHGYFIYDATIRVPLILKFPAARLRGTRLRNRVRSVDIAPTILQQVNIPVPVSMQGESLLAMTTGKRASLDLPVYSETYYPKVHFNWSPLFGFQPSQFKYIDAPENELYDTQNDAGELNNIVESNRALAARLKSDLLAFRGRYTAAGASSDAARQLDPETVSRLKSLGYVAFTTSSAKSEADASLPDPKQKVRVYNLLNRGISLSRRGFPERAIEVFTQVAKTEPSMPIVHFLLGTEYFERRWFLKAMEEFKETLKYNPDSNVAMFNLARSYLESGQTENAESGFRHLIEREPGHFGAHHHLALVHARRSRYREAVEEELKAIRIRPDYLEAHNNLGSYYLHLEQPAEAIEAYERAIALNADFHTARINLALANIRRGSYDEAIRQAREVIQRDPRRSMAHFYLGQALLAKGSRQEAREAFQKARELDPRLDVPAIP